MVSTKILILFTTLICGGYTKVFEFHNTGTKELWIGTQGNAGLKPLKNGGWKMAPKEKKRFGNEHIRIQLIFKSNAENAGGVNLAPIFMQLFNQFLNLFDDRWDKAIIAHNYHYEQLQTSPVFVFTVDYNFQITVEAPESWSGRFWARTWCNSETQHCETGDCGNKIECNGAGGHPPATLVQIALKGGDGNDYYSLSLVDGFNTKVSVKPVDGTKTGAKNSCKEISCFADINEDCPKELKVTTDNGAVACRSACNAFNNDQYCCRGAHNLPKTCTVKDWPTNYPKFFKDKCPDAYSYAYDDSDSVFTCRAEKYIVSFSN